MLCAVAWSSDQIATTLAALSVLGGDSPRFRVGCRVQTKRKGRGSAGESSVETGVLVAIDRSAGRVKVLFDHNFHRVTECDIDKLEPVPEVAPSSSLIQLSPQLLSVFQIFTQALMDEEKADKLAREQKKKREIEKKEAKEKREREKKEREKEKAKQKAKETALSSEWSCPTYVAAQHCTALHCVALYCGLGFGLEMSCVELS